MSFLSLLLLLCLSIHACNGRHLGVFNKDSGARVHPSIKDEEKAMLGEISIPVLEVKPSLSKDLPKPQGKATSEIMSGIDESLGGATTSIEKPKKVEETESDVRGVAQEESVASVSWRIPRKKQGIEIVMSSDVGLQHSTKFEVRRQTRSVLGSKSHVTEETVDSKDNDIGEDVVVMDYESPHRKPPIHNNFSP